jgi:hypothetical protein
MPTEIAVIVAGIVFAFLVFAAALAWGDLYSRGTRTEQPGE